MIVVHAGHRVDSPKRPDRRLFPPERDGSVYRRLYLLMLELRPRMVVSAAAGGSDLLMLRVAEDLFIPRTVVLPLPVDEFRRRSVADQGDRWIEAFERQLSGADSVVTADLSEHDDWPRRGNDLLQDCAAGACRASSNGSPGEPLAAVVVKADGCPPSSGTADFAAKAAARGWPIHTIDPLAD